MSGDLGRPIAPRTDPAVGPNGPTLARPQGPSADDGDQVSRVKSRRGIGQLLVGAVPLLQASPVAAQSSLGDPAGSGPIVHAVSWLSETLLGTVATVAAVIAVAAVGFLMLTGRVNWRYGATVVLGCFILFGAGAIVAGIQATAAVVE